MWFMVVLIIWALFTLLNWLGLDYKWFKTKYGSRKLDV